MNSNEIQKRQRQLWEKARSDDRLNDICGRLDSLGGDQSDSRPRFVIASMMLDFAHDARFLVEIPEIESLTGFNSQAECDIHQIRSSFDIDDGVILICAIEVKKEFRRQGLSTALLRHLCTLADEAQVEIELEASPIATIEPSEITHDILAKMYKKHGFMLANMRSKTMTRKPKQIIHKERI